MMGLRRDTRTDSRPPHRWLQCKLVLVLAPIAWLLVACGQGWNWRVLPVGDSGLESVLPCKPDAAARTMQLPTQVAQLEMRSCDAHGVTFAVAWMPLSADTDLSAHLALWRTASLASARASLVSEPRAWAVRGVTLAQRVEARGRRADGSTMPVSLGHAIAGRYLVQMATYGELDRESSSAFWDGLSMRRR